MGSHDKEIVFERVFVVEITSRNIVQLFVYTNFKYIFLIPGSVVESVIVSCVFFSELHSVCVSCTVFILEVCFLQNLHVTLVDLEGGAKSD